MRTQEVFTETENKLTELIHVLSTFEQDELNTIPFKGSWTAAQVGDHLLKSYGVVETLSGAVTTTERPPDEKVELIRSVFLDFDLKMNSPESIIPSADVIDKDRLILALKDKREELLSTIKTINLNETCADFAIPEFGEFTRLEWVFLVIFHTQRHIRQLKDIAGKMQLNISNTY